MNGFLVDFFNGFFLRMNMTEEIQTIKQKKEEDKNKENEERLFRNYPSALDYILDHRELHGLTSRQLIIRDGGLYQKLYHDGTLAKAPIVTPKKKLSAFDKHYSPEIVYFLANVHEEKLIK